MIPYICRLYAPQLCIILLPVCKMATNGKARVSSSTVHLAHDMTTNVTVGWWYDRRNKESVIRGPEYGSQSCHLGMCLHWVSHFTTRASVFLFSKCRVPDVTPYSVPEFRTRPNESACFSYSLHVPIPCLPQTVPLTLWAFFFFFFLNHLCRLKSYPGFKV